MAGPNRSNQGSLKSVAVIGAGISGLAAAYRLKSEGLAVTVFEAEESTGGRVKSVSQDGLIWEKGSNTMTEGEPEIRKLIDDLGIRGQQQFPIMQSKRYIVKNGEPELLPSNPMAFIGSKFLSAQAKLNIFMEPFLWKRKTPINMPNSAGLRLQESVGDFFRRHFGQEIVDYIIDPFVAGTAGADPDSLSMRHAFQEIWDLEERFGSIIIGAIKSSFSRKRAQREKNYGEKKQQHGSFSFIGGLQTLTNALSTKLGEDSLKLCSSVLSLACNEQGNSSDMNWSIFYSRNDSNRTKPLLEQSFDAVIMTAPLYNFREMQIIRNGKPFLLDFLPEVTYQPMSVLITTFKKQDVKRPLEGFGILIPSKEQKNGFQTLGTLFSSMMFPDRAPADQYLFTTFIGGSRNRALAKRSLKELQEVTIHDLNKILRVEGQPLSVKHVYWSEAFPQYGLDYNSVLEAIDKIEESLPGFYYAEISRDILIDSYKSKRYLINLLHTSRWESRMNYLLIGNHRGGLSVGKALVSGCKAADLVISYLKSLEGRKLCTMACVEQEA